jgi:hypothetical protein
VMARRWRVPPIDSNRPAYCVVLPAATYVSIVQIIEFVVVIESVVVVVVILV